MEKFRASIFAGLLVATSAFAVSAADASGPTIDAGATYQAQRDAILKAFDDGKSYIEISSADKERVRFLIGKLDTLLADKSRLDDLDAEAKVNAYNAQQEINTLLTRAHADSRLVCKREKLIGSNRPTNTCSTVAERRRAREGAVNYLNTLPKAQGSLETR